MAIKRKSKKLAEKSPPKVSLDAILSKMNEKYGVNAITKGTFVRKLERVSTGNLTMDIIFGGGIPVGRYSQISGGESVGKTCLGLIMLGFFQKNGFNSAYFDVEGTSGDPEFLRCFEIDVENLLYSTPSSLEETCNMILELQLSGEVHFALWDSIIATKPNKVLNKAVGDAMQMGVMQTMIDEFLAKIALNNNKLVREGKKPFTLLALNQLREKPTIYGNPEYTPGGRAKDFYSSLSVNARRAQYLVEGKGANKRVVGQTISFKTEKNKTFPRQQEGQIDLYFTDNNVGVPKLSLDNLKSAVIEAIDFEIIEQKGSYYYISEDLKFQGLDELLKFIRNNEDIYQKIYKEVLQIATTEEEE